MSGSVSIDDKDRWSGEIQPDGTFSIAGVEDGIRVLQVSGGDPFGGFSTSKSEIEIRGDIVARDRILPYPPFLRISKIIRELNTNKVQLEWTSYGTEGFREYKIYKGSSTGLDEQTGTLLHVSTSVSDTTFTDSIDHGDTSYYRVFVMDDFGKLAGSNITSSEPGPYLNNTDLAVGQMVLGYLNAGQRIEYKTKVDPGKVYSIVWHDSWFEPYTAQSVFVEALNPITEEYYIDRYRLIQMTGSPRILQATGPDLQTNLWGYDSEVSGTFDLMVTEISQHLIAGNIGEAVSFSMKPGAVEGAVFNLTAGKTYSITGAMNSENGAYGDAISINVICFIEGLPDPCWVNGWGEGYLATDRRTDAPFAVGKVVTPTQDQTLTVVLSGAYWWNRNAAWIKVTEQ